MLFIMAEEFEKYKGILDREWEEFRQQLKERSKHFLVFSSRQKEAISELNIIEIL